MLEQLAMVAETYKNHGPLMNVIMFQKKKTRKSALNLQCRRHGAVRLRPLCHASGDWVDLSPLLCFLQPQPTATSQRRNPWYPLPCPVRWGR